jgi:hypothetical protein
LRLFLGGRLDSLLEEKEIPALAKIEQSEESQKSCAASGEY